MSKYSTEYHLLKSHLSSVKNAVKLARRAARAEPGTDNQRLNELIIEYSKIAEIAYSEALPFQRNEEIKNLYADFLKWLEIKSRLR